MSVDHLRDALLRDGADLSALGEERRDEPRGRHVERRIERGDAWRGEPTVAIVRHTATVHPTTATLNRKGI